MSEQSPDLPKGLAGRRYCKVKDLMRLFDVSRATIDRWCRENPAFPTKVKLGNPFSENCSTRFIVSDVAEYLAVIEERDDLERDKPVWIFTLF